MRCKKILSFVSTLLLMICGGLVSAQNLGVYPTELDFALAKGQNESQVVTMTNGSNKKIQFRLYLGDWLRDTLGEHTYYKPETLGRSSPKSVALNKNFVE